MKWRPEKVPSLLPWAGTVCSRAALLGTWPGASPHTINLPQSGCCISHSGQHWLTSHWARGQPWNMVWERVGVQSRARDWREWALKMGWKYLAKAGQVRQAPSHCLPKLLPTYPKGAYDEAREQRGRGKLKQGSVGNPTMHISMPNMPKKGICTCLRGAPAILGKHSPGKQNLISCCCCHLRQARGDEGLQNEETIKM